MNCDMFLNKSRRLAAVLCVLTAFALAACSGGAADDELLVFAATSLTDAMSEAAAEFEATSGTKVDVSFGPSRALAQQIASGAPADLYFAAGQPPMDFLQEGGHVAEEGAVRLLSNKIVLITGQNAPSVGSVDELADAGFERIAMPDPEIAPAGNYTRAALQSLGLWDGLLPRIVFANDVRATLSYVQTGNADAGFLYQTDAATADDVAGSGHPCRPTRIPMWCIRRRSCRTRKTRRARLPCWSFCRATRRARFSASTGSRRWSDAFVR